MQAKLILVAAAMACGSAFAQAPAGTVQRPAEELNPNRSGGQAQVTGEVRNDMRKLMDSNSDGMVSRSEWDSYHGNVWSSMRADPQGNVPWADVNTRMMGATGGPVGKGGVVGDNGSATPK